MAIIGSGCKYTEGKEFASSLARLGAVTIDFICIVAMFILSFVFVWLIVFIIDIIKPGFADNHGADIGLILLGICFIFIFTYFSQVFRPSAQSIVEKIMKIRVIPLNSKRISLRIASFRMVFIVVPILSLISILCYSLSKTRSLSDLMCDTLTIEEP